MIKLNLPNLANPKKPPHWDGFDSKRSQKMGRLSALQVLYKAASGMKTLNTDEIDFEGENFVAVVFDGLEDPRIDRHKLYPVSEIFFLTLAATLVGVRSWRGAETFGNERLEWLRGFFPFEEGIPSHQTIGRVFSLVKPAVLERAFIQFMTSVTKKSPEQIIALDGKTLRIV